MKNNDILPKWVGPHRQNFSFFFEIRQNSAAEPPSKLQQQQPPREN
jgi:hypothetical protein